MGAFISACSGAVPTNLGIQQEQLAPCPSSPNCVSSFEKDERHTIPPLKGQLSQLPRVLEQMKRNRIITQTERYLHVEFKSAVMGFVDDVEFFQPEGKTKIEVRSAARLGYSDFGVNRKRMETFRSLLNRLNKE